MQELDQTTERHDEQQPVRFDIKNVAAVMCVVALGCLVITRFDTIINVISIIWGGLSPFATGVMIAYLLNLIMSRWEAVWFPSHADDALAHARRPVCLVLSLLTVVAVIAIIGALVAGELANAIVSLGSGIASLLEFAGIDLGSVVQSTLSSASSIVENVEELVSAVLTGSASISDTLSSIIDMGSSVAGVVTNVFIGLVFAIYLLASKERCIAGAKRAGRVTMSPEVYAAVGHALTVGNDYISRFFVGQFREGIVLGTICAAGMAILGLPYAATIGFIVGVGALIPIIGAWTAGILGALIILPTDPLQSLMFLIYLVILQQVDGQLIYPRIVGHSVGVSSIWVLMAVFVGGALFGFLGMLFGVPVMATARHLILEWADRREAELAARAAEEDASASGPADGSSDAGAPEVVVAAGEADAPEGDAVDEPLVDLSEPPRD